jgi:hypothetical protein
MNDVLKQLNTALQEVMSGKRNMMAGDELKLMLFNATHEIERLRRVNSDLGWQVNPDRMGGQGGTYRTDEWGNSY